MRFVGYLFSDYFCIFLGMKARQNARKNPRGKRTKQGGTSQKRPPLILAPHLGRVASSSFSLHSPLALLELSTHTKAAQSASPVWEDARVSRT